jgi:hypothetical protein
MLHSWHSNKIPNLTASASITIGCQIRKFPATKKGKKKRVYFCCFTSWVSGTWSAIEVGLLSPPAAIIVSSGNVEMGAVFRVARFFLTQFTKTGENIYQI